MTACPMAWARWLFPLSGGPMKSPSSRRPMKAAVARSKTRARFILGLNWKSKVSRVLLASRKRACLRRRSSRRWLRQLSSSDTRMEIRSISVETIWHPFRCRMYPNRWAGRGDRGASWGLAMNILLLSMPDSFEHMPTVAVRMPNGALTSLAGNVDAHHRVAAADLILVQSNVRETVERLVREIQADVVGLSVMTFQRKTALRIVQLVRSLRPAVRVVAGGYDPSLAPEAYMEEGAGIDFIVRGEGELPFRELLRAMENGRGFEGIPGLSHRSDGTWRQNPARPIH